MINRLRTIPGYERLGDASDGHRGKNWLRLGSKDAGLGIAVIFSVVESCRRLSLPIRKYPADVLPRLANRSIQTAPSLTPIAYARHGSGSAPAQK